MSTLVLQQGLRGYTFFFNSATQFQPDVVKKIKKREKQSEMAYCMSKKLLPILYSYLFYKMGEDFLHIQKRRIYNG